MSLMRLQIPKQEHRAWNIKYQPYNIAILLKEAARLGLAHLAFKMRMKMMRYNYDIRCELTAPKLKLTTIQLFYMNLQTHPITYN